MVTGWAKKLVGTMMNEIKDVKTGLGSEPWVDGMIHAQANSFHWNQYCCSLPEMFYSMKEMPPKKGKNQNCRGLMRVKSQEL